MENIDLDQIKRNIDIKELISRETGLNFKKNILEHCPFCHSGTGKHGKHDSAFNVQILKNIFTCFSCGKSGNPIDFIINYKQMSFTDAKNYLAEKYGHAKIVNEVPEPKTDLQKTIFAIKQNDKSPASIYLKSRGLNTDQLPPDAFYYDKFENAVVFFDSENKTVNKRLINPNENQAKAKQAKGSTYKNSLYLSAYNPANDKVFLVESPINALSLLPYSSIAIFSTNNKFSDIEKLSKFLKGKNVILAFDNDTKNEHNAGNECTEYYSKLILKNIQIESLSKLKLPGNKDINDLLKSQELKNFETNSDNYEYLEIDILKKPLPINQKSENKHFEIKESTYHIRNKDGDFYDISDCIFDFLYRLNDEDGTHLIKAQQTKINGKHRIEFLELKSKDLKKDSIETELNKIGFSFYGSSINLAYILTYQKHREKQAKIINVYGWQPEYNFYAFTDCIINTNNQIVKPNSIGMVANKEEIFYLQASSPVNQNRYLDLKKFTYKKGDLDFKKFADLFYKSNKLNGSIGIQFYLLSMFRDIIFNYIDFFPYLYLYGEAGGGKTSFVDTLLALFGDESKGHGLKNITQAAISRIGSQKRNALVYYKEYSKEVPNFVEDYIKTGYDGQSRTLSAKGTGNETISFEIVSGGIIDSNFLPTNETAVFTRMIILDFETTNFSKEQTNAFEQLKEEQKKGLAQITKEILNYRQLMNDNFKDAFYHVLAELKQAGLKKKFSHERTIKHIALVLTPYAIFEGILQFPYTYEELKQIIINHAIEQEEKLHSFKPTNIFWQSIAYFKNKGEIKELLAGQIENKDAHFIKVPKENAIYLKGTKFNDLMTFYSRFCQMQGIDKTKIDKPTELKSKLMSKGYEPYQPNPVKDRQQINQTYLGSSFKFLYEMKPGYDGIFIDNQEIDL